MATLSSEGPPCCDTLTEYDRRHMNLYYRLLDAEIHASSWEVAVEVLFGINPEAERERAQRIYEAHLDRARWLRAHSGYAELLR